MSGRGNIITIGSAEHSSHRATANSGEVADLQTSPAFYCVSAAIVTGGNDAFRRRPRPAASDATFYCPWTVRHGVGR